MEKDGELLPGSQCFLGLLCDGIHNRQTAFVIEQLQSLSREELTQLMHLSKLHNLPLVGEQICRVLGRDTAAKGFREDLIKIMGIQANATQRLLFLLKELEHNGIPALVVKGVVCRSLYPIPELRPSTDEDVYVEPEYTQRAEEVLKALGFVRAEGENPNSAVHTWSSGVLRVELHSGLLEDGGVPQIIPKELFDDSMSRRIYISFDGHLIPTLSHQEHFLYLILHYYKHFLSGGIGIRQISDICLYAQKYEGEISWTDVWQTLKTMSLDRLVWNLRDIGIRYLGMDETYMPCGPVEYTPDSLDLLMDTLDAGVFGSSTVERKHSSNMTIRAAKKGSKKSGGICAALFPPAKDLKGRFSYLEKHPWLLPIAWCSRVFGYFKEGKNVAGRASRSADIGQRRLELMEKYGLLE